MSIYMPSLMLKGKAACPTLYRIFLKELLHFLLGVSVLSIILMLLGMRTCSAQTDSLEELESINGSLERTLSTLEEMCRDNEKRTRMLEQYLKDAREHKDSQETMHHKEAWREVRSLNQSATLLLEASYAMAKEQVSGTENKIDSLKARTWEECLKKDCSFKKMNSLLNSSTLAYLRKTREGALKTEEYLKNNLETLKDFNDEAQQTHGLNDSLDMLNKVNSAQATALVQLNSQFSSLKSLHSKEMEDRLNLEKIREEAEQQFFYSEDEKNSSHMQMRLTLHNSENS